MDLLGGYHSSSDDDSDTANAAPPVASAKPSSEANKTTLPAPKKTSQKGKKILSLSNVLPPAILERLTKAQVLDANQQESSTKRKETRYYSDDSSSDEEEADSKPRASQQSSNNHGKDEGLSRLLADLQSTAPTGSAKLLSAKSTNESASTSQSSAEKMGAAFVTSTTTTTSKRSTQSVRNIHQEAAEATPNEDSVPSKALTSTSQVRHPIAAAPMVRPRVQAAPFVARAAPAVSAPRAHPPPQAYASGNDGSAHTAQKNKKKRSRKEMERALRHGNLAAVTDRNDVVSMEQAQPDQYTPAPETYAVPAHGIKVAATAMYDPKTGEKTVGGPTARGKNQINQLMASAADFELHRARQGGSSSGNPHRANAKQKYGW